MDIFVRHAKRAITGGGGGPGILAKESDNIALLSNKIFKRWVSTLVEITVKIEKTE